VSISFKNWHLSILKDYGNPEPNYCDYGLSDLPSYIKPL
jgi:hypothetical protein